LIKLRNIRLNRDLIRTPFLAMGAIFALLLLILGIVGYFITARAPIDGWDTTWIIPTNESAESLEQKIDNLRDEINESSSGEMFTLQITEEEATSKLYCICRDGNLSVTMKDPQIYFQDGLFRGHAQIDIVMDIHIAFEAQLTTIDGKLDAIPTDLHLGKIPIPKALVNSIVTALEREMDERWDSISVSLHDISIGDGVMLVTLEKK
jgi:hypothetical protein